MTLKKRPRIVPNKKGILSKKMVKKLKKNLDENYWGKKSKNKGKKHNKEIYIKNMKKEKNILPKPEKRKMKNMDNPFIIPGDENSELLNELLKLIKKSMKINIKMSKIISKMK